MKNNYLRFPVFYHKIKTRTYINNLRHRSLQLDNVNNRLKSYRHTCKGNENMHVQK